VEISQLLQGVFSPKIPQNHQYKHTCSGANPTTFSYNAIAVKIFNATNSTARFLE
jgi:hypothetical protein